jgi:hypothetical protein
VPRRKTKHAPFVKPVGFYGHCEMCDRRFPVARLRPVGSDEFGPLKRCRSCDTDDGNDWHGNERWTEAGYPVGVS